MHHKWSDYSLHLWGVVIISALFLTVPQTSMGQPRAVTKADLEQLKDGEVPKNAKKQVMGGMFSSDSFELMIYTPRAQAAQFAAAAKEEYIELDSSNYRPEFFNGYVKVVATNLMASAYNSSITPENIRQIRRGVVVLGEEYHEIDSVVFIQQTLQNAYGASHMNVDAIFYVPIQYFDGWSDINFVIIHNEGKSELKIKAKDIKKLD